MPGNTCFHEIHNVCCHSYIEFGKAKDERKGSLGRKCSFFSLQKSWVFFFRAKTHGKSMKGPQKILF